MSQPVAQQEIIQEVRMIKEKDLRLWLESPITQIFLELAADHSRAKEEMIFQEMRFTKMKDLDLEKLAEWRGESNAMCQLENLELFMIERVLPEETREETKND